MPQASADARNSNSIIIMHGNTDITPAVHGYHGNFLFCYSDYILETEYDEV